MRWIREAPVTAESLIICVAIFTSCQLQASSRHERFEDVQRSWGAIVPLEQSINYDGVRRGKEPELHGPFDIWDGEWWRIPIAPFHHANLMHLVLCVGATWYLGSRLEQCWGSVRTGLFLLPAIVVPVIGELYFGQAIQGFSGVVCSLSGAILVLRLDYRELAEEMPDELVEFGAIAMLLGGIATLSGLVTFPNAAHLLGFCYGAFAAWAERNIPSQNNGLKISFLLVHVWVLPALFFAIHPYWIGRYHWYCAMTARSPHKIEKNLEKAISCDPSLTGAWIYWSQVAEAHELPLLAWKRIINGLSYNPSSSLLMDSSRRIWRHFSLNQRQQAEQTLAEYFGKHSHLWLDQIRATSSQQVFEPASQVDDLVEVIDPNEFRLDRRQQLPALDLSPLSIERRNPETPKIPKDAAEGETL